MRLPRTRPHCFHLKKGSCLGVAGTKNCVVSVRVRHQDLVQEQPRLQVRNSFSSVDKLGLADELALKHRLEVVDLDFFIPPVAWQGSRPLAARNQRLG